MQLISYKAFRSFRGAFLFTGLTSFICLPSHGQEFPLPVKKGTGTLYDNDLLPKEFHAGRRAALRAQMDDSSVAVFFSASIKNRSNDVNYEFHQDPNFYYLTGLKEDNAVLFISKGIDLGGGAADEILFVKDRNPQTERWTGKLLGVEGAGKTLGIHTASSASEQYTEMLKELSRYKKVYFFELGREEAGNGLRKKFSKGLADGKVNTDSYAIKDFMARLREVKTSEEIALMRKAISFSCDGIREAIKAIEPGMHEYSAEAILEYVFKSKGAEDVGYPSIVGGGENSCILHYETNRKKLTAKDIMVCDAGAEYHGYTADITRSFPISGKFSPEQKAIYNVVLEAQLAGIAKCLPGQAFRAPHNEATAVIQKRLLELGVIKAPNEVGKYFFHTSSHYLGLDVHDLGTNGKLQPNSIITVEPGIYIPFGSDCDEKWWGIGVRIEDDILITEGQPEVMSSCVPKTVEEIEALMKQESLFNMMKR